MESCAPESGLLLASMDRCEANTDNDSSVLRSLSSMNRIMNYIPVIPLILVTPGQCTQRQLVDGFYSCVADGIINTDLGGGVKPQSFRCAQYLAVIRPSRAPGLLELLVYSSPITSRAKSLVCTLISSLSS